jgi:creatinine amidohydrolase
MTLRTLFSDTMADMTATAVAAAAGRGAGVLLPIGVIEAHGPHLPTGTDAFIATQLAQLTRRYAAARGRELVVAPPYYWGINGVLGEFTGSFNIRPQTAAALLADVIDSIFANGFGEIFIVSHHGDLQHNRMILDVLRTKHERGQAGVRWLYAPFRWTMVKRLGLTGTEPFWVPWEHQPALDRFKVTGVLGVHADEYETAAMIRYFPETVDYDALAALAPTQLDARDLEAWRTGGEVARRLTPNGYFGAPNPVDPDLWRHFDETARIMAVALAEAASRLDGNADIA